MEKYVLGMYGNEDQLDNNDRLYNKFLDIFVVYPRTHIKQHRAVYTDYEVQVKTNHPEFAIKDSHVRRRYSDFVWLKARLGINDIMMTTAPSLPGKRYFGRFKDPFLKKRQMGLQNFMNKVVEVTPFLSDPALHLFLQTDLPISQMESYLKHGVLLSNIRDRVIAEQKIREQRKKNMEANTERTCTNHTCTLKKSLSLDTIISLKKTEKLVCKEEGRGWSNFIGESRVVCHNQVTIDKDIEKFGEGSVYPYNQPQLKTTARVLPGGQLQLADDQTDGPELASPRPARRPSSWHGKTFDVVDFILDGYDIIGNGDSSNVDSMSVSHNSIQSSSQGTWKADSLLSDDGIEVDINERLSEYTIVDMLTEDVDDMKTSQTNGETNEQINHRKLDTRRPNNTSNIYDNGSRRSNNTSNNYDDGSRRPNNTLNIYDDASRRLNNTSNIYDDASRRSNNTSNIYDDASRRSNNMSNIYDDASRRSSNTSNIYDDASRRSNNTSNNYDDGSSASPATNNHALSDSKFATESTFTSTSGFHHSGSFSGGSDNST